MTVFVNVRRWGRSCWRSSGCTRRRFSKIRQRDEASAPGGPRMAPVAQAVVSKSWPAGTLPGRMHRGGVERQPRRGGDELCPGGRFPKRIRISANWCRGRTTWKVLLPWVCPKRNTSFTAGMRSNGGQSESDHDILGPIMAELVKASPDKAKAASDYLHALPRVLTTRKWSRPGMLAPSGPLGAGFAAAGAGRCQRRCRQDLAGPKECHGVCSTIS